MKTYDRTPAVGLTVGRLIEDLKKLPPDTYVWMPGCEACGGHMPAVASYFVPAHTEQQFTRGPASVREEYTASYPDMVSFMDEDQFKDHIDYLKYRLGMERQR